VHTRIGALLLLAVLAGGCGAAPGGGSGELEDPSEFRDFPLYALGEDFDGAPLESVRRRPGFVEFAYGSEPLLVQVWPSCVRNPLLRAGALVEGSRFERELAVRGTTAYVYDGGTRIEVATEGATVVVRARDLRQARHAVRALEGVNTALERGDALPSARESEELCSRDDDVAGAVAQALDETLAADGDEGVRVVECGRSLAVARTDDVDDAHDCVGVMPDNTGRPWCVISHGDVVLSESMALSCEAAAQQGAVAQAFHDGATLRWGLRAQAACEPHLAQVPEVLAGLDQERMVTDLSYVWDVMGSFEADVVADLRALPDASTETDELLALYDARLAKIDAAVAEYQAGGQADALAALRRVEDETPDLVARFEAVGAPACAPAWS
jgi:hypothetical protein